MSRNTSRIRPTDAVLALLLTGLGVVLMVQNMKAPATDPELIHGIESHSWLLIPVFALTTVPVLWRRSGATVVTAVVLIAMVVHVLVFGWVVRCGAGLPLSFVLAYSVGALEDRRRGLMGLALVFVVQAAVLVKDAAVGLNIIWATALIAAAAYGLGLLVRSRMTPEVPV